MLQMYLKNVIFLFYFCMYLGPHTQTENEGLFAAALVVFRRYLIVVHRPMPAAPRRCLIVVHRPLPAASLVARRRYLAVLPRPMPAAPRGYFAVAQRPLPSAPLVERRRILLPHGPFTVKIREIGDPTQRPPNFVAFESFAACPQGRLRSRER